MPDKIYSLKMIPGMQTDGTTLPSRNWRDGRWVRFYGKDAKKMGGYKVVTNQLLNIPRGITVIPDAPNNAFNVYIGDRNSLKVQSIDPAGNALAALVDVTPVGLADDANRLWDFDIMFNTADGDSTIIAHGPPNLSRIDSTVETPIYYALADGLTQLAVTGQVASGGVTVLGQYLFFFGNNGKISWSNINDPTTVLGFNYPVGDKLLYGLPVRGGQNSPAGLFWSLSCVVKCTHSTDPTIGFTFDSISCESSVLSSQGIIEYDSIFYWAATDRFLFYNGIVRELPNDMCLNFFFDNVDLNQRQKVWATKVTRWGEIWWFFPMKGDTECTHAVVYNVRLNKWYPTPISRADGEFDSTFAYPLWTGNEPNGLGKYDLWMHEYGVDEVDIDGNPTAILSNIQSGSLSWVSVDLNGQRPDIDRWIYLYRVEPDLLQTGDMSLTVQTRKYARSEPPEESAPFTITPTTEKIDIRIQGREMYLIFESNVIGGNFQFGEILIVAKIGDGRQ